MSTPQRGKRISVDVSELAEQLRQFTPQANRKSERDGPLHSFNSNTSLQIFSSPLPKSNPRGKPTAEEAAKALLADDPYLKHCSPHPQKSGPSLAMDDNQPHMQVVVANVQSGKDSDPESARVSASFDVQIGKYDVPFSPVLPRPINETLPPAEPLPSSTPSPPPQQFTNSFDDSPTPVSAAKPPRPPVPRLQPLNSPSTQNSQAYPSPTPSTPFTSTIPLSYSAVKTPGAAPLNFLGQTPASARQKYDPSSVVEFFRARSAHVTSPIFSTRRKLDCVDFGSPEVCINPLADSTADMGPIPDAVVPEAVVEMEFSLDYGFDRAEEVDLSYRANRVPILYAVIIRTTDLDSDTRPAFARLERDSDSPHSMLVNVVDEDVGFVNVEDEDDSDNEDHTYSGAQEAVLSFWAAPDSFVQFGSATLLLTVTDEYGESHETKIELQVQGTDPVIAVESTGNQPDHTRKETNVIFEDPKNHAEERITVWNKTVGGAPLFINAVVTDSASGTFTVRDLDGTANDCISMVIPGGKSHTFVAHFKLMPNVTLRGRYYGCVLLKLATLMPAREMHSSFDKELHQFYDHVLNFEAHIAGVAPLGRLSTLEDRSSNNIEEMLYEHQYGNDYEVHANHDVRNVTAASGTINRLSLFVSPEDKKYVPEDLDGKPYMLCEYNLGEDPRWIVPDTECSDSFRNDEDAESCQAETHAGLNVPGETLEQDCNSSMNEEAQSETSKLALQSREAYEEWKRSLANDDTEDSVGAYGVCVQSPGDNAGIAIDGTDNDSRTEDLPKRFGDGMPSQNSTHQIDEHGTSQAFEACCEKDAHLDTTASGTDAAIDSNTYEVSNIAEARPFEEALVDETCSSQFVVPDSQGFGAQVDEDRNYLQPLNPGTVLGELAGAHSEEQKTIVSHVETPQKQHMLPESDLNEPQEHHIIENPTDPDTAQKMKLFGVLHKVPYARKETGYLVDDSEHGTYRKSKNNLKEVMASVGAAVDVLRGDQRFLKTNTQFDSTFNMSDDSGAHESQPFSFSSGGSVATINPPERPVIQKLASKLGTNKRESGKHRPKLRMARRHLEKGIRISEDAGSTSFSICNGSVGTIKVSVSAKQGLKLKKGVMIQPTFLALQPQQKGVITISRLTSSEVKAHVVLACSNLTGPQNLSCTYRVPVRIEAAKNRIPVVQGFAVDRPTLSFYNPTSSARHCRVRVLNGSGRKASYKVWIGRNKDDSSHFESAFKILSHRGGSVEPQKCFSIIVVFDALGQTDYFHDKLFISVGRKTDYIPLFGYGGTSRIAFSRSEKGHLRAHNTGCRYGFLLLSGPEMDSPENSVSKVVLAPEEIRDFIPPYGSGTIIFTGDEIARTRMCRAQELFEQESGERNDESNLFVGHFDGDEQAVEDENLYWEQENKHALHYAGRLMDNSTHRHMFEAESENVVPYVDRNHERETNWHASTDGAGFIHIENYDPKNELSFTAEGAEPCTGSIPPLGDAKLAAFAETVQIFARGQCLYLHSLVKK